MAENDLYEDEVDVEFELDVNPVIHVVSDSLGDTASDVVAAAASQFEDGVIQVERLSGIRSVDDVRAYFDAQPETSVPKAVFHTIVDYELRTDVRSELDRRGIPSIDLLGPAMNVISTLTNEEPLSIAGRRSTEDERYHTRVSGMNFFAEHDEGGNPEDLKEADAVLFGVTRTSKTPLSLYLAFLGYKVANVTYVAGEEPPAELFEIALAWSTRTPPSTRCASARSPRTPRSRCSAPTPVPRA